MLFKFFAKEEPCKTCEVLKEQLDTERTEKNLLLRKLMEQMNHGKHQEEPKERDEEVVPERLVARANQRFTSIRRAELEAQDRILAQKLAEQKRQDEVYQLEKNLDIPHDSIKVE